MFLTAIVVLDILVEFSRICSNMNHHPEFHGRIIDCRPVFYPECLLIEHDRDYSLQTIEQLFHEQQTRIFHIKTYTYCSFVHFYSYHGKSN
jgi:hypothetical protein